MMKPLAAALALVAIALGIWFLMSGQDISLERREVALDPTEAQSKDNAPNALLEPLETADFEPPEQSSSTERRPTLALIIRLVLVSNAPGDDIRLAAPRVLWSSDGRDWHESDPATEFTGPSNDFVIPWSGDSVTINCGATGFHSQLREIEERPESGIIEIELHPSGSIRGQVLLHGSGSLGVEGAMVVAWPVERKPSADLFQAVVDGKVPLTPTARTDANGYFEIAGLQRNGTYKVVPFVRGFAADKVATQTVEAGASPIDFIMKELFFFYPRFVSLAADGSPTEFNRQMVKSGIGKLPGKLSHFDRNPATISHLSLGLDSWTATDSYKPAGLSLLIADEPSRDKELAIEISVFVAGLPRTKMAAKAYSLALFPLQRQDIVLGRNLSFGSIEFTVNIPGLVGDGQFQVPPGLIHLLLRSADPKAGQHITTAPSFDANSSFTQEGVPAGAYTVTLHAGHALGPYLPGHGEPELQIRVEPDATTSVVLRNDEVAAIKWSWPGRTAEQVQLHVIQLVNDKPVSTGMLSFSASQGLIPLITPGKYHVKLLARGDSSDSYRQRAEQMIELSPGEIHSITFNP